MQHHQPKSLVISRACELLLRDQAAEARALIANEYPLDDSPAAPCSYPGRRLREQQLRKDQRAPRRSAAQQPLEVLHARDGYVDRYTGTWLIAPMVLKLLGHPELGPLRDVLPYHVNGGRGGPARRGARQTCHQSGFELFASYEHVQPIAVGGLDELQNLVTASVDSNYAKGTETWQPSIPPGALEDWDGLAGWFLDYTARHDCRWLQGLARARNRLQESLAADLSAVPAPKFVRVGDPC